MNYSCPCGASAPERLPVCPACGRSGQYLPSVQAPEFPHSYRSPVLSANDLRARARGMKRLPAEWTNISAQWLRPFMLSVYGMPGSGKTTLALKLADSFPGRAIYLPLEDGMSADLAKYVERLEIMNVSFAYPGTWDELISQCEGFGLVCIDTVQMLAATPRSIKSELVGRAAKCVIAVSQVNAAGDCRGGMAISHYAHVVCKAVQLGEVVVTKNRFGGVGHARTHA